MLQAKGGGLSGGWRGFAIDNELNAGDSLLFEYTGQDKHTRTDDDGSEKHYGCVSI